MAYVYDIMLVWDPAYFERVSEAKDELDQMGEQGWEIAAITPLREGKGYAIVFQREV